MNLIKNNLENLHQYISFNLLALCGYIIIIGCFINFFSYKTLDFYTTTLQIVLFNIIYLLICFTALITYILEIIFDYKIKNGIITQNKLLCRLRYIGVLILIIYPLFLILFIII